MPIDAVDKMEFEFAADVVSSQDLASLSSFKVRHDVGVVTSDMDCETVFGVVDGKSLVSDLLASPE